MDPSDSSELDRLKREIQHLTELHNTSARRNEELNDFLEGLKAFVRCGVCEKIPRTVFSLDGKCIRCRKIVCRGCTDAECEEGKTHQMSRMEERPQIVDQLTMRNPSGAKYHVLETDDALLRPCSQNAGIQCLLCSKSGYSYLNGEHPLILGICKFCHQNVCKDCGTTICKEIGLPHNHKRTLNTTAETQMMNQIIAVSFHPCKWTDAGCSVKMKLKSLQLHELDCEFRDVRCPNDDCAEIVPFAGLLDHFLGCSETTLNDKLELKEIVEVSVGLVEEGGKIAIDVRGLKAIPVKFKDHLLFVKVGTRTRESCQLFHLYVVMNTFEGCNQYRVKVTLSYDENAVTQVLKMVPASSDAKDKCTCEPWEQNTPPKPESEQKCLEKCNEVQRAFDSRPRSVIVQSVDQLAQLCNDDEMSGEAKKLSVKLNVFEN